MHGSAYFVYNLPIVAVVLVLLQCYKSADSSFFDGRFPVGNSPMYC